MLHNSTPHTQPHCFEYTSDKQMDQMRFSTKQLVTLAVIVGSLLSGASAVADGDATFEQEIRPIVERYCNDCHSGDTTEADIDLGAFATQADLRRQLGVWLKVRTMLDSHQMPPKASLQPNDTERKRLQSWVRAFLAREAETTAGDPGPVILRRLNNAEYNYAIRDLTGIATLDPTDEFPVDGAAGEGFINTGSAQAMSPALIQKYLDAAKGIAEHAVLTPTGIAFSQHRTRRDWTDERLNTIRSFYSRYTVPSREVIRSIPGVTMKTQDGGAIPLQKYFRVMLDEQKSLSDRQKGIERAARQHGLSQKYLAMLWKAMNETQSSVILDQVRQQWRQGDVDAIVATIARWQHALWHFTSIGHIGKRDGPTAWQLPVTPVTTQQELRLKFPDVASDDQVRLFLSIGDAGDGTKHDTVIWKNARVAFADRPPIPLIHLEELLKQATELQTRELPRTSTYLQAVAESHRSKQSIESLAAKYKLDPAIAASWANFVQLGKSRSIKVEGHFTEKMTNGELRGWGTASTPVMFVNPTDKDIKPGTYLLPARGVTVHPSPEKEAIVYWQSPIDGLVKIKGSIADTDPVCGNGTAWRVELLTSNGLQSILGGLLENGGRKVFDESAELMIHKGDVVKFAVNAHQKSHACDTTQVELTITETKKDGRVWNLASDVIDRIHDSNPVQDSHGNPSVWHFCSSDSTASTATRELLIPHDSALGQWRAAVASDGPGDEIERAATRVQQSLLRTETLTAGDATVKAAATDLRGNFHWLSHLESSTKIEQSAPDILEFSIPSQLVAGAEFVATATLHPQKGKEGSVQVWASLAKLNKTQKLAPGTLQETGTKKQWTDGGVPVTSDSPILVTENSEARRRIEADIDAFRQLFPSAICYSKIVPVDEVVTLTLFHREDEHLRRLMLGRDEAAELDRLWEELAFVSREPLKLVDAFDQLYQFATQDADPSVFEPLRGPIRQRAEQFQNQLVAAEPNHIDSVMKFATDAWRRPLAASEQQSLRHLYEQLRHSEISHEDAIRLTLARVLTSPAFLYRREVQPDSSQPQPVADLELASRLSYFLWSSVPDSQLRHVAESGNLSNTSKLVKQTRRMLKDHRTRRLAIQFACQWLHLRNFDQNDNKNEKLYPEFAVLRVDMYEETIRFFEDMFRNNGSILDMLGANHTFLNETLAKHYGIDGVDGPHWRRIDSIRSHARGGVLGMASLLASQSGASRTSPILRGNWVYETLLGERLPRPPANVPQLPENIPEGLTARQLIEQHSAAPGCAKCHVKIDPFGFALEQYDAIGRLRPASVDRKAKLADGTEIEGIEGLRDYLLNKRRNDVVRQFCRKLLGFALGREVQLSDEPFLDNMVKRLSENEYRFHVAVEEIVLSDQFRKIRGASSNFLNP